MEGSADTTDWVRLHQIAWNDYLQGSTGFCDIPNLSTAIKIRVMQTHLVRTDGIALLVVTWLTLVNYETELTGIELAMGVRIMLNYVTHSWWRTGDYFSAKETDEDTKPVRP